MTKVIFLDIDGPMIPYRAMFLPDQTTIMTIFDPVAVSLLNNLCEAYGWKIVIHSSWIRVYGEMNTVNHCIEQGIKAEHFHDHSSCNSGITWRYTRVSEWLSRHPEVTNYAIIDDDPYKDEKSTDNPFPHPKDIEDHMVMVDYYAGFLFSTFNDVRAIDIKFNEALPTIH